MGKWCNVKTPHDFRDEQTSILGLLPEELNRRFNACKYKTLEDAGLQWYWGSSGDRWSCIDDSGTTRVFKVFFDPTMRFLESYRVTCERQALLLRERMDELHPETAWRKTATILPEPMLVVKGPSPRTFTRKGYGRIYLENMGAAEYVLGIIKRMDPYEFNYTPKDIFAPLSKYPECIGVGKFDDLDLDALTYNCLVRGIKIMCCDFGMSEPTRNLKYEEGHDKYYLYEETIDEGSGSSMERLHGVSADFFVDAQKLLAENPRYSGIDYFNGSEWFYDVQREMREGR